MFVHWKYQEPIKKNLLRKTNNNCITDSESLQDNVTFSRNINVSGLDFIALIAYSDGWGYLDTRAAQVKQSLSLDHISKYLLSYLSASKRSLVSKQSVKHSVQITFFVKIFFLELS